MTFRNTLAWACLACVAPTVTSCALTTKSDPWSAHYFSPELRTRSRAPAARTKAAEPPRLRVGRVIAAAHLRTAVAYRDESGELSYYDDQRWTEAPSEYLRRALGRALFEEGGLVRVVSGSAPTLDVELTAFEEAAGRPHHAQLQAVVILYDGGVATLERTITRERPIREGGDAKRAEATVKALSEALDEAVEEIANDVVSALQARADAAREAANPSAR